MCKSTRDYGMEIRRNPFTGEHTLVSPHRLSRPWQPEGFCPFCPGAPETGHGWDVLLLPNRYPVVTKNPPSPMQEELFRARKAYGQAYVAVETPQHDVDDLSDLPPSQIEKVLRLVIKAQKEAEEDPKAVYFLFFRNKGREIGVSLTHPHSQLYVLPVVPTRVTVEMQYSETWYRERGRCLHCDVVASETRRVVYHNEHWKSFVPYYARWPHEVHIYPKIHRSTLTELTDVEVATLADVLKRTLCCIKNVLGKPMPYIMVLHQAPLRQRAPHYHLHFEICGMYRPDGRLKYAAGAELGASLYTLETTPEETAERLRKALANCVTASGGSGR